MMNARHRIRLAGPWEAEVLHSSSHQELVGKRLKAVLGGTNPLPGHPFYGKFKLRRNFNLPTGLDKDSVVWLCVQGLLLDAQPEFFLNQQPLDRTGGRTIADQMEIAVTDILENFNRIEVGLSCCDAVAPAELIENATSMAVQASVWLEIQ